MMGIPQFTPQSRRRLSAWMTAAVLLFGLCGFTSAAATDGDTTPATELEMFVREACPHCEEAERFVARLRRERPALQVSVHDVRKEPAALARLRALAARAGVTAPGVPAFYLRGELIVGYAGEAATGARIEALLDSRPVAPGKAGGAGKSCALDEDLACKPDPAAAPQSAARESIVLPWLDLEVSVEDLGLPLFTVVIGLLDGFNPCSMWVLIMMISMLAAIGDRRKMLLIAGTFVAVEGIAYFAFMAAWLNLFLLIGISRASELVIGVIALIAGLINVKDFWAFGRGITLSIPAAAKPGIYARIRRVLHEESLLVALAGTVVLAVLVQLVELLCTSGFPALYTRILTLRRFDAWTYYAYLLLYNLMYMLDDIIVLAIGVVTLSQRRLQENEGRKLKLLSGVVMLLLGLYLIAVPH
jgi:hypothetical protein